MSGPERAAAALLALHGAGAFMLLFTETRAAPLGLSALLLTVAWLILPVALAAGQVWRADDRRPAWGWFALEALLVAAGWGLLVTQFVLIAGNLRGLTLLVVPALQLAALGAVVLVAALVRRVRRGAS